MYFQACKFISKSHCSFPITDGVLFSSLASLETELINVLNSGDMEESFLQGADLDPKIIPHINMPYTVVQNTFKSSIDDKIELIKEKHRRMANNKGIS